MVFLFVLDNSIVFDGQSQPIGPERTRRTSQPPSEANFASPPLSSVSDRVRGRQDGNLKRFVLPSNDRIVKLLLDIVFGQCLSFSFVQCQEVRAFFTEVLPNVVLPSRRSVATRLQQHYSLERKRLISTLDGLLSVALSADVWQSTNKRQV